MSDAIPFQAIKGEGDNEPILGEGGDTLVLPEFSDSPPFPPIPAPPVPAVVRLCPGVECCDPNPFAYSIRRTPPTLTVETGDAGGDPICSTCLNEAFSVTITATGIGPGLTWTIDSGFLPPGLTFHGGYNEDGSVLIDGTPTSGGNYSIVVKATSPTGSFVTTTFPFNVFGITSTSPPAFTVGEPYFFQLTASGGSGNYGWSIISGTLPDGLGFNAIAGSISGTPTGGAGSQPVVFGVVDITCEEFNPVSTPLVSLVTSSNTTIATVLGYSEYPGHASTPPKKYHTVTWTGEATQVGNWHLDAFALEWYTDHGVDPSETQMCLAKIVYSGSGTIDTNGNPISSYFKNYYASCPNFSPVIDLAVGGASEEAFLTNSLNGYCWKYDPNSCPDCPDPAPLVGNISRNSSIDPPDVLCYSGLHAVTTATTYSNTGDNLPARLINLHEGFPLGVTNVPRSTVNGLLGAWVYLSDMFNITAVLSDEYTDAEALTNATHIISNGRKAESFPRTIGFTSRWTTVNFDLNASNLIPGLTYAITVGFLDSDFTRTSQVFTFVATTSTKTINAQVPTPAGGHTITLLQPTIAFA